VGLANGKLNLHGWVFIIESGTMLAYDGQSKEFVPLIEHPNVSAT
jgi:carbonic anhydrase